MGVVSTQGLSFRLVANGQALDLFKDEQIQISDNITGLFDIGSLPSDFSRAITLPGTKTNNAFFEHVYDISVTNPFLFATNIKVDAYFDFGGIYVASGYLQLNRVNVIANKFIDSYEVTIFGSLSSFAREINRATLNDLTTLSQYNHTASFDNISSSWSGGLFSGDIIYPLVDYGTNLEYTFTPDSYGINTISSSLSVQNFKPAIRILKVWDAIFEEYGYSYESDFLTSSFFDEEYMICDYGLKYPQIDGLELEGLGVMRIGPISGSFSDAIMTNNVYLTLAYENTQVDRQGYIGDGATYKVDRLTSLSGRLKTVLNVSGSSGVPQFTFQIAQTGSLTEVDAIPLNSYNVFFQEIRAAQTTSGEKTYKLEQKFKFNDIPEGEYVFRLKYENFRGSTFNTILSPDGDTESYIQIDSVNNAGDYRVINIAQNLPFGESGIRQIEFIKGLQKKYNLIIYPSKVKPRHFIVETFNNWYKKGQIADFNKYINLNEKIEVIPANNLAVNKLDFGDTLGKDYIAQQFNKENNREFGKATYIDNQNFFSQGELTVETTFASSPLRYLPGTGVSGSLQLVAGYPITVGLGNDYFSVCIANSVTRYSDDPTSTLGPGLVLYNDIYLTQPTTGFIYVTDQTGDVWNMDSVNGEVINFYAPCAGGGPSD